MLNTTQQIALTGSIGSGKSTVANFFSTWGSRLIDFDLVAREILDKDPAVNQRLTELLGPQICRPDGKLDRFALRSVIFTVPELKLKVEQLLHPLIWAEAIAQLQRYRQSESAPITLVIPLLFENPGPEIEFTVKVLVSSLRENCIKRASLRDSCPKNLISRIFDSQMSPEEKARKSDFVIYNNSDIRSLEERCREVFRAITGFC